MTAAKPPKEVDVLICGGGPVGLLIAYCLARYGVSTYVVEQHERAEQTRHGRAAMIAPRTLEMLDQLDLADSLGQIGFVVRGQLSFKNGEKVDNITAASSNITDTFFDHLLLCRQRYTEDVIREGYSRYSNQAVHYGARLTNFFTSGGSDGIPILSTIQCRGETQFEIRSRYLIGADGGRSKVREIASIRFEGESSSRYWVRIDGIVDTNMPEARRGICGIESPSHGSILWACLDHGATRVGFALPKEVRERLGSNISRDDVILEAQKALRPFNLQFKTVDWWTVYSIGQRLAAEYCSMERVFLAGDAAHTHSSGAAQGMNTGLHDAVNLSWKLAGCIKGQYVPSVLASYEAERRPVAQKIIDQDKVISVVTGGEIPEAFKDDPNIDAHELLTDTYKKNASLNTGLGVTYFPDDLTIVRSTSRKDHRVMPGERAPDVLLQKPGMRVPARLFSLIKNMGKFALILFCGDASKNCDSIAQWQEAMINGWGSQIVSEKFGTYLNIILGANDAGSPNERLGVDSLGYSLYDVDGSAHARYGVPLDEGAVFILRPDGGVGTVCDLGGGDAAFHYFDRFIVRKEEQYFHFRESENQPENIIGKGEIDIDKAVGSEIKTRIFYD
ncbi:hypothetical protein ACLMJK_005206 [Lecanora helva]